MLIGYMRVSKADGSQTIDLQRDALIAAGVDPAYLYEADLPEPKSSNSLSFNKILQFLASYVVTKYIIIA